MPRFYLSTTALVFVLIATVLGGAGLLAHAAAETIMQEIYGALAINAAMLALVAACVAQGTGKICDLFRRVADGHAKRTGQLAEGYRQQIEKLSADVESLRKIKTYEYQARREASKQPPRQAGTNSAH